jgi:hypothetical protein
MGISDLPIVVGGVGRREGTISARRAWRGRRLLE